MSGAGSGSGSGRGRRPRSGLTSEEQALWDHAARTLTPLRKVKSRVPDGQDGLAELAAAIDPPRKAPKRRGPASAESANLPGLPARPKSETTPAASQSSTPASRPPSQPPDLAGFDRKSAKRLRAGHIEIEARIDLHGMRQDEAYVALERFLVSCRAQGRRWVLVITGKGLSRRSASGFDADEDAGWAPVNDRPGVIRRNLPVWLSQPHLRAIVVSYTNAAPQHGGEGAFYVQLRKRAG